MPKELTVAQLERLLERQRTRLNELVARREKLRKQLEAVEAKIAALGGAEAAARRGRRARKRPRNDKSLLQSVVDVLSQGKRGATLKELSAKILEGGYKTVSRNFENTVYQIIYTHRDRIMHDPKTKTYRLK